MTRAKKLTPAVALKLRAYEIITDAISKGVEFGLARAYKYSEEPHRDAIAEHVEHAVTCQISEVLDFGGEA